ncbi:LytR C-terminal domain-containing protein [Rhodococcus fascians]|nr:LytR C-terminal domain-containing protein [Rhodococcus fascians]
MSSPNPEQTGPPLRALAMVLISLAILFAAIGALSLTGSDSDEAAAETTAAETTSAPAAAAPMTQAPATQLPAGAASTSNAAPTTSGSATTSGTAADVEVRVLNNSNVSGLAAGTASTLTAGGWNVAETGNFSEAQFAQTAVYYGAAAGEEQAAQSIATELGVPAEAKPASLESTAGVVVIVTQ